MLTRLLVLAATLVSLGLAGCGGADKPPQLSEEERKRQQEETQRMYQEKMGGGMKPGMKPAEAMQKYKPAEPGK